MEQGARFAKWGLGLFIFGVFLTFGIVAHYCVGARWPTGELFMQNISLWWACPIVQSSLAAPAKSKTCRCHPTVSFAGCIILCIA